MKHADPKVIWLASTDANKASELALELQRYCRSQSIPAMVVDEFQTGPCSDADCTSGNGRLCRLAKSLATQGYPVIVAAEYRDTACQVWNRAHLPGYFEVHLKGTSSVQSERAAPIAPDIRLEAKETSLPVAEFIFEEVFGRGQLLPGSPRTPLLPAAGLMPSMSTP